MRTQLVPAGDGSAIAATTFADFAGRTASLPRSAAKHFGERFLRIIGRSLIRLPASTWLLVDVTILTLALFAAFETFPPPGELVTPHIAFWQAAAIFAFSVISASLVFGLYERETLMSRSRILLRMLLTTTTATVIVYAIIYVVMYATVSRRASAMTMSLFLLGGVTVRLGAWWVVQKLHWGLLIIGSRRLYDSYAAAQRQGLLHEYRLVGYAATDASPGSAAEESLFLGTIYAQLDRLRSLGVTDVVVGDEAARDPRVMDWMIPCLQRGCRVIHEAFFYEKATGQILVDQITPSWFLFSDLKVHCDEHATLKRVLDLTFTALAIAVSAPLWPLIALAVKLGDGGSVLYSQDRVGQNGRIFRLYKFRTMRPNAENGKSVWASPGDPRVTPVGRLLRKTRLDELPQLYNVLVGDMSLVGPRPERPDIVRELCDKIPFYAERHLIKPGITGWAQISFRYGSSIEDARRKLQYDLYYMKHISMELDIIILFRTAGTFLRGAC